MGLTGTQLRVYGLLNGPALYKATFTVDNRLTNVYENDTRPSAIVDVEVLLFDSDILSPGTHELDITNLGDRLTVVRYAVATDIATIQSLTPTASRSAGASQLTSTSLTEVSTHHHFGPSPPSPPFPLPQPPRSMKLSASTPQSTTAPLSTAMSQIKTATTLWTPSTSGSSFITTEISSPLSTQGSAYC